MKHLVVSMTIIVSLGWAVRPAFAQEPAPAAPQRPLNLEVGSIATVGVGHFGQQSGDMGPSRSVQGAVGLVGYVGWLTTERWSVGLHGAFQWAAADSTVPGKEERLLWLLAEPRFFPTTLSRFHAMLDLGVVLYRETIPAGYHSSMGDTVSQWAPAVGIGGAWIPVRSEALYFAVELRGLVTFFRNRGPIFSGLADHSAKDIGTAAWLSAQLTFGLRTGSGRL
jgi:hypothetical protein